MILKNGKRIDGCSDTVPIGVLSPFLGLTPPNGYLVCQGQLVSKTTYPELYEICGNSFGTATDTHFYLPDLRGKTVVGYNSSDTSMNAIGKLLGSANHTHSTGNHTLTVAEMPSHDHYLFYGNYNYKTGVSAVANSVCLGSYEASSENVKTNSTGGSGAHNHGDTGSASNYQPSLTANWIVKAAMLIPDYFIVENTLESDNTQNALSAAQGKVLNSKITNLAKVATSGSYNDLTNKPTIPTVNNATLTIQKNGSNVATFTSNSSTNVTANISVPTITDTYSSTSTNGMSGKAVSSAVSAVSNKLNFSTSEIEIGTWNGRKAYRKIIVQTYSKVTDSFTISTGLSNVSIFNIYGTYIGGSFTIPINFANDGKYCFCHTNSNGTVLTCANAWETGTIHIVLEYVKN